jgi:hypothetical protein
MLLDQWASVAEQTLSADATFLLLASDAHRDRLNRMLQERGVNVARAIRDGRYVALNNDDTLSRFMVGDRLDETLFWNNVTSVMLGAIRASTADQPYVIACGECAPALCAQGNAEAAVHLEQLWDQVTRTYRLDTFCAFSVGACQCDDVDDVREKITAVHTATYAR